MGFLGTLFGGEAEADAAEKNRELYNTYGQQGAGYLKDAYSQGRTDLGGALGAWDPLKALSTKFGTGTDMLLNAYGLNGPAGNAAAVNAFQAGPGYGFQFDQGMEALKRMRAGGNMAGSGNADIDAIKFGSGLANQEYKNWETGLAGINQNALTATTGAAAGQAGAYSSLADLANQYGQNQVNLAGNVTGGLANANTTEAAGKAAGAKNLLGAGMSLATLGLSGGTGGFGSSLAGTLFNKAFPTQPG